MGGATRAATGLPCALASLMVLMSGVAHGQSYAVGQRVECDPLLLKKYYKPGVVIAPKPGDKFNGVPIGTPGASYLVKLDDGPISGSVCPVDNLRPAGARTMMSAAARGDGPAAPAGAPMGRLPMPAAVPARYGSRAPRACTVVRNLPNAEQAKMLVQCDDEHVQSNLLYLNEHLTVQAGGTRRYIYFQDNGATGIDTTAPVLPIRGSMDAYQCVVLSRYTNVGTTYDTDNTGKNCRIAPQTNIQGSCWRTTFGEWHCHLNHVYDLATERHDQPPPR